MPRRQVVAEALKSCRSVLIGVGLVSLVINLLMLTGPMFMLQVYDRVLTSRSIPTLLALAGIAIGLYVFFGVLDGLRARILTRVGARIDRRLSSLTFDRSITLPLMGKQQNTRLEPVRDLDAVRQFMSGPGPSAFFDMPWMPLYIAVVFFFHPVLGFLALGGAFIMCVLIALNEMMASKPVGAAAAQSMKRNALVEGSRRNAEAIVAMGMVSGLRERWVRENESFLNLQGSAADRVAGFSSGIKMFRFILQSSILGVGAFLAVGELISPGMMIAASIITARAVAPIEQAVTQWRSFIGARLALKRLRLVLDGQDDQTPETELPLPTQSLEVEGIFVGAPGERTAIVEGVSFKMRAGEALAIIGPSGSGKSTLGRAIVGVWSTLRGDIRLDGADLDQWDPDRLGQAIGYLPQDVQLFQGTVAENIARFRPDWTSEDVIKAAQLANAHELITNLSDGYDTQIGEGGMALSGGQRQRIALARALYGDPFLIVLDEPNSNLDAEGEGALTQAIKTMRAQNCIVIVIAHRPSALQAVETVLYLNDGRAGAYGPRDEVLKKVLSGAPSRAGKDLKVVGDT